MPKRKDETYRNYHPSACTCYKCTQARIKRSHRHHFPLGWTVIGLIVVFVVLTILNISPISTYGVKAKNFIKENAVFLFQWSNGTSSGSISGRVENLYLETNTDRLDKNLRPFIRDTTLENLAQAKAVDMYKTGNVDHNNFENRSSIAQRYGFRFVAENVAGGGYDASSFNEMWMESPGHRANILDPQLTHIGIGIYGKYAAQLFGGK